MKKDVKDFDKAMKDAEEFFPADILERIFNGDNAVMVFRKYRGLSEEDLSERTGLSLAFISQIETSKEISPLSELKKIAKALNVDIDLLV